MNRFKITILLKNGATEIIDTKFKFINCKEFYREFDKLRRENVFIEFTIDNYIVGYRCEDISRIKIEMV